MSETIRIVLADDHAVVRRGIREFLEHEPRIRVIGEAGNGEEAIDMARRLRPDVLVLDIQMPYLTGIEVVRVARHERLPCAILMLTAYADQPFVSSALRAGANGYVLKTAGPEELIQAVIDVHDGRLVLLPAALAEAAPEAAAERLSAREIEVLELVAAGYTNKAIASRLSISDRTVQSHIAAIFDKLHAQSRTEAVTVAIQRGIIAR